MIILNCLPLGLFDPRLDIFAAETDADATEKVAKVEISEDAKKNTKAERQHEAKIPFTMAFRPYM